MKPSSRFFSWFVCSLERFWHMSSTLYPLFFDLQFQIRNMKQRRPIPPLAAVWRKAIIYNRIIDYIIIYLSSIYLLNFSSKGTEIGFYPFPFTIKTWKAEVSFVTSMIFDLLFVWTVHSAQTLRIPDKCLETDLMR